MVLCACTPISSQEPARVLKRNAASGDAIASTQILVHTREHVNFINKYGGRRGKFLLSLLCSRDLDKNSSVQSSSCIRMVDKNSKDLFKC